MDFPGSGTVPDDVQRTVGRYLRHVDRALPGRVVGFYLVGSVALGAYRRGRSDIDFVAVLDGSAGGEGGDGRGWSLSRAEIRGLRRAQLASGLRTGASAVRRGHLAQPGTCNGVFVRTTDLVRPVTAIEPLAGQVGTQFRPGWAFDVNPVQWTTFSRHGVAVRGAEPATLRLDPEPERLGRWNLDNLAGYWVPWAERTLRRPGPRWRVMPGWSTAWGVLGAPRLHHTVATGDVISKEAAGAWAKEVLDARHHAIADAGLAWWRGEPVDSVLADAGVRARATAELVLAVAEAARAL